MTAGPLVVDTNVLVAGLITSAAGAPTARLLDELLAGRIPFLLSTALLAEYRRVLLRPKLRAAHGLAAAEVDALLLRLAELAIVREPAAGAGSAAGGDEHLFALLALDPRARLVSGDAAALRHAGQHGGSPREWLEQSRRER